jgi:predicted nuclease with TOPRIM domain
MNTLFTPSPKSKPTCEVGCTVYLASLEARCVTEDFQDYQARIDGIIEDIATWQTEHGLGEDQIKTLQETGRSLHDQDKAHNDEIEKLKARIDEVESATDQHQRQLTIDGERIDVR